MKIIKKTSLFILTFIFAISIATNIVLADSNGLPFSVEPILPENQNEDVSSYISVSPTGRSLNQPFEFKLTNRSDQDQDIKVTVVDAYTSPNGVIQYVQEESENSQIINDQYKLSHYLESDSDIITLEKGETRMVSTSLHVEDLGGVLLGGVSFSAIVEGEEQEEGDNSFQINNEINMVIGVMASFDTDKGAEFIIGEPFLDPMPSYFAIRLPITLDAPVLQQDVLINYQVMHHNEELFNNEKDISFAPYSKTNIAIPFEHDEIVENETYVITGALIYTDQEGNEVTNEFHQTFEYVTENSANNVINTLTAPIEKSAFPLWTITLASIPLLLLLFFIYKKRKHFNWN